MCHARVDAAREADRAIHILAEHRRRQPVFGGVGDAPSLVARWAVQSVAKAGTIGVIGVYPPTFSAFPIGDAMNKNLTIQLGNCPHRRFVPRLLAMVGSGSLDPTTFITQHTEPLSMDDAYEQFDRRGEGWLKTVVPMG
jgi:threonine dehydrogenase-like Zn-dependent dehydrogenase